eukprot:TRINITY_DN5669_c0_g1_i1.p1 TRINITY_DN5669_c0_g1~~TRINITY_DN5669_c0_g1_i1.p1  ORF type:complete len:160 (-),score=46.59 TRINITY_DN5669_c0_g1_i1:283-711(-)
MVLSYDWSEGGDVEVVVEDIERLNLDYHDKYDKQQKIGDSTPRYGFASKRQQYTNAGALVNQFNDPFWSADKLILTSAEGLELEKVKQKLQGMSTCSGTTLSWEILSPFLTGDLGDLENTNKMLLTSWSTTTMIMTSSTRTG